LIKRLKTILTNRIIKFLNEQSKLDNKKFTEFYEDYKMYFKEAIARSNDTKEKEDIASLLRFETNKTESNHTITLDEYIKQMKPDQKSIYYFAAPTREIAMNSPYFEAIKQKDFEVLFLFEPHDEIVVLQLGQFQKFNLSSIESEIEKDKLKDDLIIENDPKSLSNDQANELKTWLKKKFGNKVKNIKITTKLENHPVIVSCSDMGAIRHFIKTNLVQRDKVKDIFNMIDLNLEINPKNSIIKTLYNLQKTNQDLAELLADQLLDNALLNAGLIDDPRFVLKNLNTLLEKVFENKH
jgi:TNF receptor-associated protein 1